MIHFNHGYTQYMVVQASSEQIEKLYKKYVRPCSGVLGRPIRIEYVANQQGKNEEGVFKAYLIHEKIVTCQVRAGRLMFVEFTGFRNVRYDITYPETKHPDMYRALRVWCEEAIEKFWSGANI